MKRLFTAIDLPDQTKTAIAKLSTGITKARWEKTELLHLTLRFIGDADETQTAALQSALAAIRAEPFRLEITGTGTFPPQSRKPARILWAGVAECPELMTLQQAVDQAVQACGFPAETRAWKPHITLARFKQPPGGDLKTWLQHHAQANLGTIEVREFQLYESQLLRTGAVHTKLQTFALAPS